MSNIKLFEQKQIRSHWDEKEEQWYFSIIDVVEVLTSSSNPRDYWFKMKVRVKSEDGLELSTICRQFKLKAADGKMRETDVADTKTLLCIIQSIPSPNVSYRRPIQAILLPIKARIMSFIQNISFQNAELQPVFLKMLQ